MGSTISPLIFYLNYAYYKCAQKDHIQSYYYSNKIDLFLQVQWNISASENGTLSIAGIYIKNVQLKLVGIAQKNTTNHVTSSNRILQYSDPTGSDTPTCPDGESCDESAQPAVSQVDYDNSTLWKGQISFIHIV